MHKTGHHGTSKSSNAASLPAASSGVSHPDHKSTSNPAVVLRTVRPQFPRVFPCQRSVNFFFLSSSSPFLSPLPLPPPPLLNEEWVINIWDFSGPVFLSPQVNFVNLAKKQP